MSRLVGHAPPVLALVSGLQVAGGTEKAGPICYNSIDIQESKTTHPHTLVPSPLAELVPSLSAWMVFLNSCHSSAVMRHSRACEPL